MKPYWKLVLLFWLGSIDAQISDNWSKSECAVQNTCHDCIQHRFCAWCLKPDFQKSSRCFHIAEGDPHYCPQEHSYNPDNTLMILESKHLSRPRTSPIPAESYVHPSTITKPSSNSSLEEIVQFQPQRVSLKMRARDKYTIHAQYSQVEEFPLDIYFLMDFSKSMEGYSEKLTHLADNLAETIPNITTNLRLGFGSFSVTPLQDPCPDCNKAHSFQHVMSLSTKTIEFSAMVKKAVTANFSTLARLKTGDLPINSSAGLDAITQAIVCKQYIGWRQNSRRVLIFVSNSKLYSAEKTIPNYDLCHWGGGGGSANVAGINENVKKNSISLLFAVTADQISNYMKLQTEIEGATTGMLSTDSSNIVDIVKEGYNKISAVIQLKDNSSDSVTINYYSNCLDPSGEFKKTDKCENVKVGDIVTFKVEVEVTRCPKDPEDWKQRLQIYPMGVKETMYIDLEMLCSCQCEQKNSAGYVENATECNGAGTYKCGICECNGQHFGKHCECSSGHMFNFMNTMSCLMDPESTSVCSGRGVCQCGKCICDVRSDHSEKVYGQFCECDNFSCPIFRGRICGGHGFCECGVCKCESSWEGEACETAALKS